jgi:hypothetical protein
MGNLMGKIMATLKDPIIIINDVPCQVMMLVGLVFVVLAAEPLGPSVVNLGVGLVENKYIHKQGSQVCQ